jgi:hypothetical protein
MLTLAYGDNIWPGRDISNIKLLHQIYAVVLKRYWRDYAQWHIKFPELPLYHNCDGPICLYGNLKASLRQPYQDNLPGIYPGG